MANEKPNLTHQISPPFSLNLDVLYTYISVITYSRCVFSRQMSDNTDDVISLFLTVVYANSQFVHKIHCKKKLPIHDGLTI